ncbi:MAG: TrkA C-terminal domain-containing protein, partial [Muribaculaceae bacterium]|nr:TrkA C-terminal domain-containing protein [Muribaculaceae bacterium]
TAQIRAKYCALLVAIQHPDGTYVHPDGTTKFNVDDVLWLVGNPKRLEEIR